MSWVDRHHRVATIVAAIALVVSVAAFGLALFLNGQQNERRNADRATRQAVNAKVDPIICHVVWAYQHRPITDDPVLLVKKTWHEVGVLLGCPNGILPKGD